jgi:hypothetical protein
MRRGSLARGSRGRVGLATHRYFYCCDSCAGRFLLKYCGCFAITPSSAATSTLARPCVTDSFPVRPAAVSPHERNHLVVHPMLISS